MIFYFIGVPEVVTDYFFYLFTITCLKFVKYYLLLTFSTSNNDNLQEAGMYDQYIIFFVEMSCFQLYILCSRVNYGRLLKFDCS